MISQSEKLEKLSRLKKRLAKRPVSKYYTVAYSEEGVEVWRDIAEISPAITGCVQFISPFTGQRSEIRIMHRG
jgi:hypothetical protein